MDEVLARAGTLLTESAKAEVRNDLVVYINHLLLHDFPALVHLLYRIDVDEKKLRQLLHRHPDQDAAYMLADLILERMEQKHQHTFIPRNNASDEERW